MELTILTPTYNRASLIKQLYASLEDQTCKKFEWLVVDDGSSDDTEVTITNIINTASFQVRYYRKENGGKHTALNVGIKKIDSDLTFIVDSDDRLTPDAVESILKIYDKYRKEEGLCGYSFLRLFPDGKVNGKPFKEDEWIASLIESRINSDDATSDKAEVYYTEILKEYPFPEYPGEKFLGEDLVWIRIARKYKMVHVNKGIYIGEYMNDGLTKNRRISNIKSPIGCMERAKEFMYRDIKIQYRIKGGLQYIIYGSFAGISNSQLLKQSPNILLYIACLIPGKMLYYRWRKTVG